MENVEENEEKWTRKEKNEGKWEKNEKGKEEMEGKKGLKKPRTLFFFFFFFFFCLLRLGNGLNFFWAYQNQNGTFYREKAKIMPGKNWEK